MTTWDWAYAIDILPQLFQGLWITLQATFFATILALFAGLVLALGKRANNRLVSGFFTGFVEFIRRTPVLVQLYLVFYVLPNFDIILPALVSGILALGFHTAAYMSEVYRAGIESVPKGQWESAKALNIPMVKTWRHIILPQALPPMVPAAGNYVLMLFKETVLLSTITIVDVMGAARIAGNETYRYLEPITLVGIIYLIISLPSALVLRHLEELLRHNKKLVK